MLDHKNTYRLSPRALNKAAGNRAVVPPPASSLQRTEWRKPPEAKRAKQNQKTYELYGTDTRKLLPGAKSKQFLGETSQGTGREKAAVRERCLNHTYDSHSLPTTDQDIRATAQQNHGSSLHRWPELWLRRTDLLKLSPKTDKLTAWVLVRQANLSSKTANEVMGLAILGLQTWNPSGEGWPSQTHIK